MRVYVDSSALLKRALKETDSGAVRHWLDAQLDADNVVVTSALASVEVSRSIGSRLDDAPPRKVVELIETALSGVLQVPLSEQVVSLARRLGPSSLRTLDAIHLASATLLGADLVCTYDRRMLISATELGFATSSPA